MNAFEKFNPRTLTPYDKLPEEEKPAREKEKTKERREYEEKMKKLAGECLRFTDFLLSMHLNVKDLIKMDAELEDSERNRLQFVEDRNIYAEAMKRVGDEPKEYKKWKNERHNIADKLSYLLEHDPKYDEVVEKMKERIEQEVAEKIKKMEQSDRSEEISQNISSKREWIMRDMKNRYMDVLTPFFTIAILSGAIAVEVPKMAHKKFVR